MLNAESIIALLANATPDTIIHIDYVAGRPVSKQAVKEYAEAQDWNKAPTSYVGNFVGMKANKWGQLVVTLWVHNRGNVGAFRAFNPSVGTVLSVKVDPAS